MRVIVVGAGEVGSYVAERLSRQGIDVIVIEQNAQRAAHLAETLDVEVLSGSGTHPATLATAGLDTADILVAVTKSDEVNIVASMLAKDADVPRTVVRIEATELRGSDAAGLRRASGANTRRVTHPFTFTRTLADASTRCGRLTNRRSIRFGKNLGRCARR